MKRKILLSGSNRTLMNDFFTQMEFTFECMITSERWDDAQCHVKYFQPDLMVFCLWKETKSSLNNAARLKFVLSDKDIPVVLIGDKQDCADLSGQHRECPRKKSTVPFPLKILRAGW